MDKGLKVKILNLRISGKSYRSIAKHLNCSRGTVAFHCGKYGATDVGFNMKRKVPDLKIIEIQEFYKSHTGAETSQRYGVSVATVKRYAELKRITFSAIERARRNKVRVISKRQEIKLKAIAYKGGKCGKCGYNKCIWALDFHHKESSSKEFAISRYLTLSWSRTKAELDKCELICSNCHRELHYNLKNKMPPSSEVERRPVKTRVDVS